MIFKKDVKNNSLTALFVDVHNWNMVSKKLFVYMLFFVQKIIYTNNLAYHISTMHINKLKHLKLLPFVVVVAV